MKVEANQNCFDTTGKFAGGLIMITPAIGEDYWLFRVHLYKDQYLLAFPKFTTIGIGFAKEEDWNTNLPYTSKATEICEHIWHNRLYVHIEKSQVVEAIKMLQAITKRWREEK